MFEIIKERIESITIKERCESYRYIIHPEKTIKRLFREPKYIPKRIFIRFEGEYVDFDDFYDEDCYIDGDKIYIKPTIYFKMVSGQTHLIRFENMDLLNSYYQNYLSDLNVIKLK